MCEQCCEIKDGKCTRVGKNGDVGICWMANGEGEYQH